MCSWVDVIVLVWKLKEMGMKVIYIKFCGSYGDIWYCVNVGLFFDVLVMNKVEDCLVVMRMMLFKRRIKQALVVGV